MDARLAHWTERKLKREGGASPPRLHTESRDSTDLDAAPSKPALRDLRHHHTASVCHKPRLTLEERNCVSKSPPPGNLVEENQRLRKEILALRQVVSDLKKQIAAGAVTGLTLANYEQELSLKNERLQDMKNQFEVMFRGKVQRLETQWAEAQTALAQARLQIEQLSKRDSKPQIYEAMSLLQAENKVLKEKIADQVETKASQQLLQQLEEELSVLERAQEKLLRENKDLRALAESSSTALIQLRNKVTSLALTLTVVSQEFSQLTEVLKLTQKDVPLSGHVLMQRLGQTFAAPTSDMPMEILLEQAVNKLSDTLAQLRRLLSEAYLEECGQTCVQQ